MFIRYFPLKSSISIKIFSFQNHQYTVVKEFDHKLILTTLKLSTLETSLLGQSCCKIEKLSEQNFKVKVFGKSTFLLRSSIILCPSYVCHVNDSLIVTEMLTL